jgi:hypothetical protein
LPFIGRRCGFPFAEEILRTIKQLYEHIPLARARRSAQSCIHA